MRPEIKERDMPDQDLDQLLREQEAAELLGVSHRTLQRWRCTGEGPPFIRCGPRAIGYCRRDLLRWIVERRHQ